MFRDVFSGHYSSVDGISNIYIGSSSRIVVKVGADLGVEMRAMQYKHISTPQTNYVSALTTYLSICQSVHNHSTRLKKTVTNWAGTP